MTKISLSLCVAVPLLFALSGCTVSKCEGDECDFDFGFDDGGSTDGGSADGGTSPDGGSAGEGGASGGDAGAGDGGPGDAGQSITLEDFCFEQAAIGEAWLSAFSESDGCCSGATAASQEVALFLDRVLRHTDTAVEDCVARLGEPIDDGRVVYNGESAMACADAYVAAFEPPAATCPVAGFDLIALEGALGHGLQFPKQIPACQATFVGKVGSGGECTDQFECAGDLRCRTFSGVTNRTCQDALGNGATCVSNNECEGGLTCVGAKGTKQCLPNTDLAFAGGCELSSECQEGRICSNSGACVEASGGTPICAM